MGAGIPLVPIRSSILSHLGNCCPREQVRIAGEILRNLRKKLVTMSGEKIATHYKVGKAAYAARKCVVEPVFGQIKQARGFRQFLLRGKEKVKGEWALVCLTHNILRLYAALQPC